MIRFLLTIVVLFAGMTAEAQQSTVKRIYPKQEQKSENRSERRKAERKQRQSEKFIQAEIDSINYANALQALENLDFVLEADQLVFKRGMSVFVPHHDQFHIGAERQGRRADRAVQRRRRPERRGRHHGGGTGVEYPDQDRQTGEPPTSR